MITEKDFNFFIPEINYVVNKFYNPNKNLGSKTYNQKENMVTKLYEEYTLSLCTEGEGYYIIDNKEYYVKKGDVSFFSKGTTRSYKNLANKKWKYITINFDINPSKNGSCAALESIDTFNKNAPYELQQLFIQLYDEWIGRSLGYTLKCKIITQEILMHLINFKIKGNYHQRHLQEIENARIYIQNNINRNIDFDKLIEASALSPTHFRRLFKKKTGYSPRDYYNYIKIKQAKEMLKTGVFTVSEIANELGYSSVYYFSATFKKYYNISPNNYIKSENP